MARTFGKVLICGGSGFIGSNFIRHLYHAHPAMRIFNLDLLTYAGNPDNLADIEQAEASLSVNDKRYFFIKGDICNESLVHDLFHAHQFDLVVNFAAESHVDRSIINSVDFVRTNIEGVRSLIEAVRKFHTPRFIQVSTDEIYGPVLTGQATEEAPFRPSNPYSAAKASADLLVQAFMCTHRIPALIVRGSNNFGPYQYPEKLIPLAITNILEGKKIPVHGTGAHVRSWIHVQDFCEAIDRIAHEAADHATYNVSGEEKSNLEVLTVLARHLGVDLAQHKEHVGDRPGADLRYAPNSAKIREELGWMPRRTFEASAADLVAWYTKNGEWWRKIRARKEFLDHYEKQSKAQYY